MVLIPNLPVTKRGIHHLLVVVEYFTKWAEAFPLPKMRAETIASVFRAKIVERYGAPCSVHTDQGLNLDGNLFRDVCSLLGVQATRMTAYHRAGDGPVERPNQIVEKLLFHYVSSCHDNWDTHLPKVLIAFHSAVQSFTTYTPHYLMFGWDMHLPSNDVVYGLPTDHPAASSPPASVWRLCECLADAHALVREKLRAVHRHRKANFDRHAVFMLYTEGDLVWLLTPSVGVGLSSKFSSPWRGPYEVVDCTNGVNCRLRATWAPHRLVVAYVNRMKRCFVRPQHLQAVPEDQQESLLSSSDPPPSRISSSAYSADATDSQRCRPLTMASNACHPSGYKNGTGTFSC